MALRLNVFAVFPKDLSLIPTVCMAHRYSNSVEIQLLWPLKPQHSLSHTCKHSECACAHVRMHTHSHTQIESNKNKNF